MRILRSYAQTVSLLLVFGSIHFLNGCGDFWQPPTGTRTSGTSTTTTIVASSSSVAVGSSVTLTAAVAPAAATGTVTFFNGSNSLGTAALASGTSTLATSFSTTGAQSLTATYGGDSTYGASTSSALVVTVTGSTAATVVLTPSASSPNLGAEVILTATVTPADASGEVIFSNGTKSLGTGMLSAGTVSQDAHIYASGDQIITAVYRGDSTYAATQSDGVAIHVGMPGATPTTLSIALSPDSAGSNGSLVATVSPSDATGEVTFYAGTEWLGSNLIEAGTAILLGPMPTTGPHAVRAVYSGDSTYHPSSAVGLTPPAN